MSTQTVLVLTLPEANRLSLQYLRNGQLDALSIALATSRQYTTKAEETIGARAKMGATCHTS
jgi:hypothetical protein